MRFIFLILALLISTNNISYAAVPTRSYNYVSHTTIDPAQNNANENSLYSYLQAGVDTYSSGSITNDAISSIAAISYSKLNLIGSVTNADISASAGIVGSKLNLTSPGIIGSGSAAAGIFTTLTGTDITASSTFKLGSAHQGDILYDNGTSLVRLTPGTNGQFLQTQGTSANPIWSGGGHGTQVFTTSDTFTAPTGITKVYLTMSGGGGGGGSGDGNISPNRGASGGSGGAYIINSPYTVISGNSYTVTINSGGDGAAIPSGSAHGTDGAVGGSVVFDTLTIVGGGAGKYNSASTATAGGFDASTTTQGSIYLPGGRGGTNSTGNGGAGGSNFFGLGGIGATGGAGANGNGFGSGGGGGNQNAANNQPEQRGGNGGSGIVIVTY